MKLTQIKIEWKYHTDADEKIYEQLTSMMKDLLYFQMNAQLQSKLRNPLIEQLRFPLNLNLKKLVRDC